MEQTVTTNTISKHFRVQRQLILVELKNCITFEFYCKIIEWTNWQLLCRSDKRFLFLVSIVIRATLFNILNPRNTFFIKSKITRKLNHKFQIKLFISLIKSRRENDFPSKKRSEEKILNNKCIFKLHQTPV